MRKFLLFLLLTLSGLVLKAQTSIPTFISDSLDNYISEGIKDWDIPGLAIAIVKDGKTVLMKGFGVKDLQTKEPVDENTLFMIASNSKLFTGTALAKLEFEKRLSLDDKVTKYFPDYRLYDSNSTALVSIRDLLCHRIGTKTFQGDFVFWNSSLGRKEIMKKMSLLKPIYPFRQQYGYCNSCFMTAGEIIPKVTGQPWEVYVYDSIIIPLGMMNTHTLTQGISQRSNVAKPYTNTYTGKLTEMPFDNVDNIGAAASIVSNVKDLSKWLLMQLDSGRYEGKRIFPWEVLQKTRDINIITRSRKSTVYPMHFQGYGLGIFSADYNGRQVFWHTGGADGYVTNTCFVPEENLGITILTNNDNQSFFELLRYQILDAYLGVGYTNRSKSNLSVYKKNLNDEANVTQALNKRVKENKPPLSLDRYTGTFINEIYGDIEITQQQGLNDLIIKFKGSNNLLGKLQYMDNEEWLLSYNILGYGIFPVKFIASKKELTIRLKVNNFIDYDYYVFAKYEK